MACAKNGWSNLRHEWRPPYKASQNAQNGACLTSGDGGGNVRAQEPCKAACLEPGKRIELREKEGVGSWAQRSGWRGTEQGGLGGQIVLPGQGRFAQWRRNSVKSKALTRLCCSLRRCMRVAYKAPRFWRSGRALLVLFKGFCFSRLHTLKHLALQPSVFRTDRRCAWVWSCARRACQRRSA
jgi:hypothetical protein